MPDLVRLQKLIAQSGLASRHEAEEWIRAGRVAVNGRPAQLGARAGESDAVTVDGTPIAHPAPRLVVAYHKPVGQVCTRADPQGRPTVFDAVADPDAGRWISVGRLDIDTSGLLLLTTDGALAHRLMHPSRQVERRYQVRVHGAVTEEQLRRLRRGVELADGPARFASVSGGRGRGRNRWYGVTLHEGRQREVRRLFEAVGARVSRLMRTGYGPVELARTQPAGSVRALSATELRALARAAGPG